MGGLTTAKFAALSDPSNLGHLGPGRRIVTSWKSPVTLLGQKGCDTTSIYLPSLDGTLSYTFGYDRSFDVLGIDPSTLNSQ